MQKGELWQVYKQNGLPLAGEGWDSALGNPEENGADVIIGVSVVFLYRLNEAGGLELLWQKRSDLVSRHPGDYDISAGGHINMGETMTEAAAREVLEEIGVKISEDELKFVTLAPFNKFRFAWVYAVDWTGREETFSFNDQEVSEVKWVPLEETDGFRFKYAKEPLKKDKITFTTLNNWFRMQGLL